MGDLNNLVYLKRFMSAADGPVLEVGSKDYGTTQNFRPLYPGCEYVGIDLEPGKNVDVVLDLQRGIGNLPAGYFALAICCSVLEHVPRPWVLAENLSSLVRKGGALYISVPWVQRYHPYPDDYFRFSWRGIKQLFPQFLWSDVYYSTTIENELIVIADGNYGVDGDMAKYEKTDQGMRKYLPYLLVNMLGRKQ